MTDSSPIMPSPLSASAPRRVWRAPEERLAALPADAPVRADEFGPEVARAIADLRTAHGHHNVSCQTEGNNDEAVDELRRELTTSLPAVNRRGFMQLTGAAAVFALAGCYKKHPDTIVPYAHQPEGRTLGKAVYFSSTLRDAGRAIPVMVKTYDGRPIKIEGNPDHPLTRGTADVRTQASLLNLYDPDRLQDGPKKKSEQGYANVAWSELDAAVGAALKSGGRIGLITGPIDGPANVALISAFSKAFGGQVLHGVHDTRADLSFAAGRGALVRLVDKASALVTFGGDYLADIGLEEQVAFGDFRRLRGVGKDADLGQIISFEAALSQTGSAADLRVRVAPDRLAHAAWGVAELVAKATGQQIPAGIAASLAKIAGGKQLGEALGLKKIGDQDALAFTADRLVALKKAGKHSLAYAAAHGTARANAALLLAGVHALNALLGNEGVTVIGAASDTAIDANAAPASAVLAAAAKGELGTLIISSVNPVFDVPGAAEAIAKVKTVVVLADRLTETARVAHFVAPTLHDLESWGDGELRPGVLSLQQPCIVPLWDVRAKEESLLAFAVAAGVTAAEFVQPKAEPDKKHPPIAVASGKPLWVAAVNGVQSWQRFVQRVWQMTVKAQAKVAADDRAFWNGALSRGVLVVPAKADALTALTLAADVALPAPVADGELQLVISPSRIMGDGTWLNNAWLQELPDPVSKVTWDNYLAMAFSDVLRLGLAPGDVVELKLGSDAGSKAVSLPVHIQEGQHPGTLQTFSGWGRARDCAGEIANAGLDPNFSVDVKPLLAISAAGANGTSGISGVATINKTGANYVLANVQGHNRMHGRDIALDDVLDLHREDPGGKKRHPHRGLWHEGADGKEHGRLSMFGKTHDYVGHKWGMSVDLGSCIGCNACVVACNAENNIPVVGRDEVRRGREMHWLRIDRYYSSEQDDTDMLDVDVIQQPVMCQQCDNAPCEEACPAMATMHNDEGINVMVYNRCIGTRYCSNNCPYKVRRFNWYEYGKYRFGPQGSGDAFGRIAKNLITSGATSSQSELSKHPLEMALNPEVTVRSRGVMEKCNFCLQRTRDIRDREKTTNRAIRDGEITTACAQTCPTKAITFGDLNDETSAVNVQIAQTHGYKLLDSVLNTRPAVTYLAKIRNRPATEAETGHGEAPAAAAKPEGAH
ncbi:MAG: 4Fe-4S dicluster domain-containing protein [Planctomycetes bacterium]|nr:4Fe-4S dicluster domain-containing protein [Planctomycetota bacterium]